MKWESLFSVVITDINSVVWQIRKVSLSDCWCIWYHLFWSIHFLRYCRISSFQLLMWAATQWEFTSSITRSWSLWTGCICCRFLRWTTCGFCWAYPWCLSLFWEVCRWIFFIQVCWIWLHLFWSRRIRQSEMRDWKRNMTARTMNMNFSDERKPLRSWPLLWIPRASRTAIWRK